MASTLVSVHETQMGGLIVILRIEMCLRKGKNEK